MVLQSTQSAVLLRRVQPFLLRVQTLGQAKVQLLGQLRRAMRRGQGTVVIHEDALSDMSKEAIISVELC